MSVKIIIFKVSHLKSALFKVEQSMVESTIITLQDK